MALIPRTQQTGGASTVMNGSYPSYAITWWSFDRYELLIPERPTTIEGPYSNYHRKRAEYLLFFLWFKNNHSILFPIYLFTNFSKLLDGAFYFDSDYSKVSRKKPDRCRRKGDINEIKIITGQYVPKKSSCLSC